MPLSVGAIGGGQLARMMIPAAVNLGLDIRVLAENEGSPAALAASAVGDYRNLEEVLRFAQGVDAVTFDHEHVPQEVLRELVAQGINVQPGPDALQFAQDKLLMRQRLTELGLPVPVWAKVENVADVDAFVAENGGRAVVKTSRGGYDGKGVRVVRAGSEVADWFENGPLLVEELVDFRRELAQSIARSPSGELMTWPVVESVQRDGVCAEVIAPAPKSGGKLADVAEQIARSIAEGLGVTGVLAVELFETIDDRLLVNELAMRPHNSGHWTIEGSRTSQFEQHLRAVLDLPLGDTAVTAPVTVMANVLAGDAAVEPAALADRVAHTMAEFSDVKVHLYGKTWRPGRKVGHVTAQGNHRDRTHSRAVAAASFLAHGRSRSLT